MIVGPVWTCPPMLTSLYTSYMATCLLSQDLKLPEDVVYPSFPKGVLYGAISDEIHNPSVRELIVASTADAELKRFVALLAQRNLVKWTEYDAVDAAEGENVLSEMSS